MAEELVRAVFAVITDGPRSEHQARRQLEEFCNWRERQLFDGRAKRNFKAIANSVDK